MTDLTAITVAGTSSKAACTQLQQSEVAFVFMGTGSPNATALQHSAVHFSNPVHKGQRNSFLKEGWTPNLYKYAFKPLLKGCTY